MANDASVNNNNSTVISGATWEMPPRGWSWLHNSTLNLFVDYIQYDYADFRDVRKSAAPGSEPLYGYDALVLRLFVSAWF